MRKAGGAFFARLFRAVVRIHIIAVMSVDVNEILRGVNHKDAKAWEKLYASYYAPLCAYVDGIVRNAEAAKDIVQDTLIRIWDSDRKFPDVKELTWYLYRASCNNALYYLRTRNFRRRALQAMDVLEAEMPEEQFALTVQEELVRQLYVYMEDLPEERRKILSLSIQGYSGNEIAALLDISINTVKTQKNRAFKYLREKLKGSVLLFLI